MFLPALYESSEIYYKKTFCCTVVFVFFLFYNHQFVSIEITIIILIFLTGLFYKEQLVGVRLDSTENQTQTMGNGFICLATTVRGQQKATDLSLYLPVVEEQERTFAERVAHSHTHNGG